MAKVAKVILCGKCKKPAVNMVDCVAKCIDHYANGQFKKRRQGNG